MNRGFSLVQVFVSLGLLGLIILSGFKIFESQTKLGKSSSFLFESMVVLDEMKSLLSDPLSCKSTFGGKSVVYDEVPSINKIESVSGQTMAEYETSEDFSSVAKVYGQGNVHISSIEIFGDQSGFENLNDYNLVKIKFKEKGGVQSYTGEFPLRITANELGRIVECESSPGLHSEGGGGRITGPWAKGVREESEFAFFGGEKVEIGQVSTQARLAVEGGAIFWASSKEESVCDTSNENVIVYFFKEDNLFRCERNSWISISSVEQPLSEKRSYRLKGTGSSLKTELTKERFSYCRLERMQGVQGKCSVQAKLEGIQGQRAHFNLMLRATPGHALECDFSCF